MKKIYITGISGTGKTTVAEELNKKNIYSISIDETPDLCFWVNKKTGDKVGYEEILNKEFIDSHSWVCDVEYLKKLMDKEGKLVVVLGIASNQKNYLNLFDKVLLLQCNPKTFIKRIEERSNNDFGKDKTAQESILAWYKNFEDEMIEKGAISIDTEKPIEEVVEHVIKEINS